MIFKKEEPYLEDKCSNCNFKGMVSQETRFCPSCEVELEGWNERKRGERLKYKQTQVVDGLAPWDCKDC